MYPACISAPALPSLGMPWVWESLPFLGHNPDRCPRGLSTHPDSEPLLYCLPRPMISLSFPGHLKTSLNLTFFLILTPSFFQPYSHDDSVSVPKQAGLFLSQRFQNALPSDGMLFQPSISANSYVSAQMSRLQINLLPPPTPCSFPSENLQQTVIIYECCKGNRSLPVPC